MNIRMLGFNLIDFLTGSCVKSHLKNLETRETFQGEDLNVLLHYAVKNIEFYMDKNLENKPLKDYPIVDKKTINKYRSAFENEDIHIHHRMRTSGTTGEPLVSNQDKNKRKSTVASLIYYNQISGVSLGEKYLYVKSFSEKNQSLLEKMKLIAKNEVRLDVDEINDKTMEKFIQYLDQGRITSVIGYAAFYEYLAFYINKKDIYRSYKNVNFITTSSVLPIESKMQLRNRLSVSIYDRYANQEIGVLAHTLGDDYFHVSPQIAMEVLDPDSGKPVKPGEMGQIVVTDLYNIRMPFIRYNTGDFGIVKKYNEQGFVAELDEISGREVTMIPVDDGYVTSHAISVYMRDLDIQKWQVVVFSDSDIQLNIITDSFEKAEKSKKHLEQLLRIYHITLSINNPSDFIKSKSGKEDLIIHAKNDS